MAVYKTRYGDVTVADGLPALSPEILQWIDERVWEIVKPQLERVMLEAISMASQDLVPPMQAAQLEALACVPPAGGDA